MQFMMELEIDLLALDQPERLQTYFSGWNLNDFLTQAATDRGELLYSL
ncbi:hypothetical protein GYH30_052756 [Glycine max]|nr:hypothetical protein GYH30_052756 [Glycine max]